MQPMFADGTDWKMPWLPRVLPNIVEITCVNPERTIFTRFIPAGAPGQGSGMWRRYYERWSSMTIDPLGSRILRGSFRPPAPSTNTSIRLGPGATCTRSYAARPSIR